jgi:hypothetical protein
MILNSPIISGSLTVTGNIITSGSITISGSIASASYASNADLLDGLDSTVFTLTSSFNAQTASFTAFTASLNAFSASQNSFTASILAQTASLNAFSASVLSYTASQNILNGTYTLTSSFNAQTASFTAFTSSINTFSASILTFTGSASTRLGALESYTSSLNAKTASFATTGSNTFTGIQTVNSNLVVTGSITAQTLVVQTVTSSIIYSSGSNIFGNAIGNSQTFTGSILITGSLALAGAATFNNSISANGGNSSAANNVFTGFTADLYAIAVRQKGASAGISGIQYMAQVISALGAEGLEIYTPNAKELVLGTNATERMRITSTGSVGIGTPSPTEKFEINVGCGARYGMAITGEYPYLTFNNCGSSAVTARSFALTVTSVEAGDFAIKQSNTKGGNPITDGYDPFRINRGGDITIACSLTIAGCGLIMSGTGALTLPNGTTAQRPGTPTTGMIRYNNATNTTEYYNGCGWYAFSDNYVHGVDMLMVSAGGGGGVNLSGAGGGGGVLYFTNFSLRPGIPITIIVGGGGSPGYQGNASCAFGNILCGGQGASQVTFHRSGNSGFLASLANSNCYTSVNVYCNNLGGYASGNAGAGGAGAGAPGADMCGNSEAAWKAKPGACGAQVGTILDGVNNYYWAGGGGGEGYGDYAGAGGCGGGGGGGSFSAYGTQFYPGCGGLGGLNPGCPGTVTNSPLNGGTGGANTGGGGGGGSHTGAGQTSATGGSGGSGIVILRYPQNYNPPTVTGTTPCICTYCGYRSYIFLSSGTITF